MSIDKRAVFSDNRPLGVFYNSGPTPVNGVDLSIAATANYAALNDAAKLELAEAAVKGWDIQLGGGLALPGAYTAAPAAVLQAYRDQDDHEPRYWVGKPSALARNAYEWLQQDFPGRGGALRTTGLWRVTTVDCTVTATDGMNPRVFTLGLRIGRDGLVQEDPANRLALQGGQPDVPDDLFPMVRGKRREHRKQIREERDGLRRAIADINLIISHNEGWRRVVREQRVLAALQLADLQALVQQLQVDRQAKNAEVAAFATERDGLSQQHATDVTAIDGWVKRQMVEIARLISSNRTVRVAPSLCNMGYKPGRPVFDAVAAVNQYDIANQQISRAIVRQRTECEHGATMLIDFEAEERGYPGVDVDPWGNYLRKLGDLDTIAEAFYPQRPKLGEAKRERLLKAIYILQADPGSANYEARKTVIEFGEWLTQLHVACQGKEERYRSQVKDTMMAFCNAHLRQGTAEKTAIHVVGADLQTRLLEQFPDMAQTAARTALTAQITAAFQDHELNPPVPNPPGPIAPLTTQWDAFTQDQKAAIDKLIEAAAMEKHHSSLRLEDVGPLQRLAANGDPPTMMSIRDSGKYSLAALRAGVQPKPHALGVRHGLLDWEDTPIGLPGVVLARDLNAQLELRKQAGVDVRGKGREFYVIPNYVTGVGTMEVDATEHAVLLEKSIKPSGSSINGAVLEGFPLAVTDAQRLALVTALNCVGLVGHWINEPKTLRGVRVMIPKVVAMQDAARDAANNDELWHDPAADFLQFLEPCRGSDGEPTSPLEAYVPLTAFAAFDGALQLMGGALRVGLTGDYDLGNLMDMTPQHRADNFDGRRASEHVAEGMKGDINTALDDELVMHGSQDGFALFSMRNRTEFKPPSVLDPAIEHSWITGEGVFHSDNMFENIAIAMAHGCKPELPPDESHMSLYGSDRRKVVDHMGGIDKAISLRRNTTITAWNYDGAANEVTGTITCTNRNINEPFSIEVNIVNQNGQRFKGTATVVPRGEPSRRRRTFAIAVTPAVAVVAIPTLNFLKVRRVG